MTSVHVGEGSHTYAWRDGWAAMPKDPAATGGWAHHDVVVTAAGEILAFHQTEPKLLVFDGSGALVRAIDVEVTEAHGATLVDDGHEEHLWVGDIGFKVKVAEGGDVSFGGGPNGPQVVKLALDGRVIQRLDKPDHPTYEHGRYLPTSVAVDTVRGVGSGDVWVADGYGKSYVHRYDREGKLLASFNGEESDAGRFDCPHALFIDRRRDEPELYIADRGNARLLVYALDGGFRREISGFFTTPSALATFGEYLIVAELNARLTICDGNDELVCYLGDNEEVCASPGWPNETDENGHVIRRQLLEPGKFNSPHGLATDAHGNIYVSEWLIGGRFTKLEPV